MPTQPPTSEPTTSRDRIARRLDDEGVRALTPEQFTEEFRHLWKQGEHLSAIAPTGSGKTTFVLMILRLRRYVLALDIKGGDETLAALRYPRLSEWPGIKKMRRMVEKNDSEGKPSRYIVGPVAQTRKDLPALKRAISEAMDDAYDMGGWTTYADELQILTDPRMMGLAAPSARNLVAARSKRITFVSAFQGPRWVISEAIGQPTWIAASYTRDTDTVNRMAEVLGRPRAEVRGVMKAIPEHWWIVVGRSPRAPYLAVKPPYVAPHR